ncbi:MAG TPA: hypothetical protein VMJ73_08490 [Rhizomicrobium sp.]|nr:hypothetical protein [Rhizomicrobium sp.]
MSLFELVFGLSAVILGLALTQLVSSLHRLMLAGRRVRWAPEPLLLGCVVFVVIVVVWLFQWQDRHEVSTTVGMVVLQVLKMLAPFLAAAFVLPDKVPEEGEIDLLRHYDRTRAYTYGALIVGLLLFWLYYLIQHAGVPDTTPFTWSGAILRGPWLYIAAYAALILVRARWFNISLLLAVLGLYGSQVMLAPLVQ